MSVILCRAQPVEGDPQDEDVVRVHHNHTCGISGISVEFEGERREVRHVSRQVGQHGRDHTVTILAHLKRRKIFRDITLKCRFVDDMFFLTHIKNMKTLEACLQFYNNDPYRGDVLPRNLLLAKMRRYAQKGWIAGGRFHSKQREVMLSGKGLNVLNTMLAGDWPRHA